MSATPPSAADEERFRRSTLSRNGVISATVAVKMMHRNDERRQVDLESVEY